MSAIIEVRIDGLEEVRNALRLFHDGLESTSEGLVESIQTNLMPDLQEASSSVWNVRTGAYSAGWGVTAGPGSNAATVFNTAESLSDGFPYPFSLEFGWTTRGGTVVESQGVLFPTVFEVLQDIVEGFGEWLMTKAGL